MKPKQQKKPYKRIALALSLCALIVWGVLGAGTTLAWFTDTSEEVTNLFHMADFELAVSHRLDNGTWELIENDTPVFDEQAVYEPGYVQVVYLKVQNIGDRAFNFKTAVTVSDYTVATNAFGQTFNLQDYLRFGVVTADSETAVQEKVGTRPLAAGVADRKLNNYSTETAALNAGDTAYVALVVCMPEQVGNQANYRGDTVPRVELGVVINAFQQSS